MLDRHCRPHQRGNPAEKSPAEKQVENEDRQQRMVVALPCDERGQEVEEEADRPKGDKPSDAADRASSCAVGDGDGLGDDDQREDDADQDGNKSAFHCVVVL